MAGPAKINLRVDRVVEPFVDARGPQQTYAQRSRLPNASGRPWLPQMMVIGSCVLEAAGAMN